MSVYCDPKKTELGIITSEKALRVLEFLESCAGAPEPAVSLLFPDCRRYLRILRGSGYARRCWAPGQDPIWCPVSFPVPRTEEEYAARSALGWLAARLAEAGGRMERGRAVFPSGEAFRAAVWPGRVPEGPAVVVSLTGERPGLRPGQLWASGPELRGKRLKECLKN